MNFAQPQRASSVSLGKTSSSEHVTWRFCGVYETSDLKLLKERAGFRRGFHLLRLIIIITQTGLSRKEHL